MKLTSFLTFYVFIILLISCTNNKSKPLKADIKNLKQEKLKFTELPDLIKEINFHHYKQIKKIEFEKLRVINKVNNNISGVYNLNNDTLIFKSRPPSPFYNTEYFILKDKMYSLSIHNNTINEPLIFFGDTVYFRITNNLKFCNIPDSLWCKKLDSYYLNAQFGKVILPQ